MKKIAVLLVLASVALCTTAMAQTDNHTVTVVIPSINEVAITGGNLTLTFVAPTAGSDPADVSDGSACDLNWSTNNASHQLGQLR